MLTVEQATWQIGSRTILAGITASFDEAKMHLILGPNGSGKSTLMRILSGQLAPTNGQVMYGDTPVCTRDLASLARYRAVLSQQVEVAFPMTAHEVVMMGRYPHFTAHPSAADYNVVEEAMEFFDVVNLAGQLYSTLSGGEKQRVHFARVLAQIWRPTDGDTRYLLMDEPLTFLDIYYQYHVLEKLKQWLTQQRIVFVGVVHDLNLAMRFADTILLLHQGRSVAHGKPAEVMIPENIRDVFQVNARMHHDERYHYLTFQDALKS